MRLYHMRCGVVMKVRQAATTPAMMLDVIRIFSLGNLKITYSLSEDVLHHEQVDPVHSIYASRKG